MLMNENSELRSFVSCSKNFSKNIINKSIKNNIVPINNDGGVKSKRKHRGFIPSTFGVTVTYTKFSLYIKKFTLISSPIIRKILIIICILFPIVICIVLFISFFVVPHSFIRILIQISNSTSINISFSSSFISFIYISFISFIISSIFTSFTGLFISYNTVITI